MRQEKVTFANSRQDLSSLLENVQRVREAMERMIEEDAFGKLAQGLLRYW
ncbi:hypothetical protein [Magnetovibrio sp.]